MDDQDYTYKIDDLGVRQRSRRRFDLLLRTYSWFGLLLAIVAGGYFFLTLLPFDLSVLQQSALIMAGVGALLSLLSRTLVTFYKEREAESLERTQEHERLVDFLAVWAEFERVSKKVLSEEGGDLNLHSFRSVISCLYSEGKIDTKDAMILEKGLRMRNSIVHGERSTSTRVTARLTTSLVEVIRKIAVPAKLTGSQFNTNVPD